MSALVYLLLGCIAPLAAGPLAGIVFMDILKRRKPWYQIPFWALLVLLNLLVMYWVISSSGVWLSISSFSAFFATPVAAILTVPVMRIAWRRLETNGLIAPVHKDWLPFGLVLIPVLQIGTFVALLIFAPLMCKAGLLVCRDVDFIVRLLAPTCSALFLKTPSLSPLHHS